MGSEHNKRRLRRRIGGNVHRPEPAGRRRRAARLSAGRPGRQRDPLLRVVLLVLARRQHPEQAGARRDHVHRRADVRRVRRLAVVLRRDGPEGVPVRRGADHWYRGWHGLHHGRVHLYRVPRGAREGLLCYYADEHASARLGDWWHHPCHYQ